jgi:hypothetical protein
VVFGIGADPIAERREVFAETAGGLARAQRAGQKKATEKGEECFHHGRFWQPGLPDVEDGSAAGAGDGVADSGHVLANAAHGVAGRKEDGEGEQDGEEYDCFHGGFLNRQRVRCPAGPEGFSRKDVAEEVMGVRAVLAFLRAQAFGCDVFS